MTRCDAVSRSDCVFRCDFVFRRDIAFRYDSVPRCDSLSQWLGARRGVVGGGINGSRATKGSYRTTAVHAVAVYRVHPRQKKHLTHCNEMK